MSSNPLNEARDLLRSADRVVILTGAGISTASGIPDYRGPDGVWTKNPGAEVRAHIDVWMSDPDVRRAGWLRRANTSWEAVQPNAAHFAIAQFAANKPDTLVLTQNIDGLHQKSGLPASQLVEVHGTVLDSLCMGCGAQGPIDRIIDRVVNGDQDPRCEEIVAGQRCGGILKAATISFGQSLRSADLMAAERAARNCDVFLALGSTLAVYPIAAVVPLAEQCGAHVIIANGQPTEMDAIAELVVRGDLTQIVPDLLGD